MKENSTDQYQPPQFKVSSVKRIDSPDGASDVDWFHYVIAHEASRIDGKRPGTQQSVTDYAEEYADRLNSRPRMGYSAYAVRKNQK